MIIIGVVGFGLFVFLSRVSGNMFSQFNAIFRQADINDYNFNHPKKITLTKANVVKTFTPSPFIKDANDDQDNVNQQINLYLNSITNANDYRVQTTTTPGSLTKDYSATITLTKKELTS